MQLRFDDYHRTIIGYHGTTLSTALKIINRVETFKPSTRDYDWLGNGIYFWEYSPQQAVKFAEQRRAKRSKDDRIAVIASMIRLGYCLDLTEPANVDLVKELHDDYQNFMAEEGVLAPTNDHQYKRLDRAVFEYACKVIADLPPKQIIDTARGIYVPTGTAKRAWAKSWISSETHIQICVRNSSSILGSWLYNPDILEAEDVCQVFQAEKPLIHRSDSAGPPKV
jgi:hypothetical protein